MNGTIAPVAAPAPAPDDDAARMLDKLDCYEHTFGKWRPDIERNERARLTESRVCLECGYAQVRGG